MAKDTIYLANLKASEKFGNKLIKGALCIDDLLEILEDKKIQDLTYEYEGKKFLNIEVIERKEPNNFGKTHFMKVSEFKPDSSKQKAPTNTSANGNDKVEKKPRARKKAATK